MEILHALVANDTISLWVETDVLQGKGRKTAVPRHPFALDDTGLNQCLAAVGLDRPGQRAEQTFWCPAGTKQPLPSHPLLGPVPPGEVELKPWHLTSRRYEADELLDWLLGLPERELLHPGRMLGREILYLRQILQLSLRTVAAGQFLPGLHQPVSLVRGNASGPPRALWKPVLSAPQRLQLQQWAQAMPAALRACDEMPPAPLALLNQLTGIWVDALVRRRLPPAPLQVVNDYDAWVMALYRPDGQVEKLKRAARDTADARATAWRSLSGSLGQWERPLQLMAKAPFRLCLQLSEPEAEAKKAPWRLEAQVQSFKDPSLRIPLAQAWQGQTDVLRQLQTPAAELKEFLLTALGQACALFTPLEGLLRTGAPATLQLDTAGAWRFLSEAAGALEQAGFGLLLPAWWTRPEARKVSLRAAVKASGTARLNLASLLRIDWQVAIEGESLSLKELRELATLKQPLVQFRGQWRLVDGEDLKQALAFLQKQPDQLTLRELLPVALGSRDTPFEVDRIDARGQLKELLDQLLGHKAFDLSPLPRGFRGTLRPYQERGWSWMQFYTPGAWAPAWPTTWAWARRPRP